MIQFVRRYKVEIIIFIVAFLLRSILFYINFTHNQYDLVSTIEGADGYFEIAQNILAGNGFSFNTEPPYTPNSLRPPVWPSIIAFSVAMGGYWLALFVQMLMGSAIPVLGMKVSRYIIGNKAVYVGWILAILPFSILLSTIFYSETSFTFFFLIALIFLFEYIQTPTRRPIIWCAVFLNLALLIKPTVQYFPILIPLGLIYLHRNKLTIKFFRDIVLFVVVSISILTPWFYRNYYEFNRWGISAQPEFNLYVYVVPSLLSIDKGTNFATEVSKIVNKPDFNLDTINLSNANEYRARALSVIVQHKTALLKSIGITLITFFTHDGMLTVLKYSGIGIKNVLSKPLIYTLVHPLEFAQLLFMYAKSAAISIIIMRLAWVFITILFLFGSRSYIKKEGLTPHILTALLIIGYFALTTSINGLGVNARFRVPVEPLILCIAIYGFFAIKNRVHQSNQ